jgi:hypothetical protein
MRQVFDDGSTLTVDAQGNVLGVTDAPSSWFVPPPADPGAYSAGASDWTDVLKFGLSRAIDAHYYKAIRPQNAYPSVSRSWGTYRVNPDGSIAGLGVSPAVMLIAAGLLVFLLVKK